MRYFTHPDEWARLSQAATNPTPKGYQASLVIVDDVDNDGAQWRDIIAVLRRLPVAFIADVTAMTEPGFPVLVIDSWQEPPREPFRCTAAELVSVENNLSIFNMDWEDFAGCVESDGVFRGSFTPTPLPRDGS